ncbi:MAG: FtsX-like permease family protein, partial [Propionibacteriaceae bacterium]|nr:FtsX-like permease family protein [Propionibacteriaceae bacterium]
ISATFDSVAATHVLVQPKITEADQPTSSGAIPWDAEERTSRLNGVISAGALTDVSDRVRTVTALSIDDPTALPRSAPTVVAVSAGLLDVISGQIQQGAFINTFQDSTAQPVAVLGAAAAKILGVRSLDIQQAIFINDEPYAVIGIVNGMQRHPELESAVIIPQGAARQRLGLTSVAELQIRIDVGAGLTVGQQLPLTLNPTNPTSLVISSPSAGGTLQDRLSSDVNTLFLALGLIAAGIGALTIAATTSLSVMERKGEIGLRRALGATSGQIALLLLAECAITGLLGGLTGAGAGVCAVVTLAASNQWTPVLDTGLIAVAAVAGTALGIAAGLVPAIRATRIEPSAALQEGT